MGKKKFIDNKKAVTLRLMDICSKDENELVKDRVFVRTDDNPVSLDILNDDSVYADGGECGVGSSETLPEHVRKEIMELGFPDDGYNYLIHLREMRNAESGSLYFPVKKSRRARQLKDVKAYDASKVQITEAYDDPNESSIYSVASNTVSLKGGRAADSEVAALLDDSDLSRFDSDIEELEEDFVIQANIPLEVETVGADNSSNLAEEPEGIDIANGDHADSAVMLAKT